MKFAERLCKALKENNMSQSELARRIKMSCDSVNGYCLGKSLPPIDVLVLICKELNETSDYLIGLRDD
jgi:transcriptional regulator with XRE-family HTH domain